MDIKTPTEFKNYVQANGLSNLHQDITQVLTCISEYERGCNCWQSSDRTKLYNNCKALYIKAVNSILTTYKAHFLQFTIDKQLNFYLDGRIIGSIRR